MCVASSRRATSDWARPLQSWWWRWESSEELNTDPPVNHWTAKKITLAIRKSWNGATYGFRTPLVHDIVSSPGWRNRHHAERAARASMLVKAWTSFSARPLRVRSRGASGSSPQRAQNGVVTITLQVGQVQRALSGMATRYRKGIWWHRIDRAVGATSGLRDQKIAGEGQSQRAYEDGQHEREGSGVGAGQVGLRQRGNEAPVLYCGNDNGQCPDDDKCKPKSSRQGCVSSRCGALRLQCKQLDKQTKTRNDKTKRNDREPCAKPRKKRALGGKEQRVDRNRKWALSRWPTA